MSTTVSLGHDVKDTIILTIYKKLITVWPTKL